MTVHPRYRFRLPYQGEERVLRLLEALDTPSAFAVHSLNLPDHEYKRWGEADFVVVSPEGVTVLEVKGGTVSFIERVWRYANARGQAIESTEGPARQALSASLAVETMLTEVLGRKVPCRWGVAFPLCVFHQTLAELPANRLAEVETCSSPEDFGSWLDAIPFPPGSGDRHRLSEEEVARARAALVPVFHAAESLGLAVSAGRQRAIRLTAQQVEMLEQLQENPRLLVLGGAGTGKTELAVATARVEHVRGNRPVLVAPGPHLVPFLRRRLGEAIPVTSDIPESVPGTLIVDEGQDFTTVERMARMFASVVGGVHGGRWRWFMDPNLQFVRESVDPDCLEQLRRHGATVTLTKNVRTTREIVGCVRALLQADLGLSSVEGFGRKVQFQSVDPGAGETRAVVELVSRLVGDGVQPADVVVLGPLGPAGPVCAGILRDLPGLLEPFEGAPVEGGRGIVASIEQYRGLESAVVVLVDLDLLSEDELGRSLLYVGMTRAVAALWLMAPPATMERVKELLLSD